MTNLRTRKRKTQDPCPTCFMHRERCICHLIPKLELSTRICLVIHHREVKRTSNTGLLATKALSNSEVHIRGLPQKPLDLSSRLTPDYESYVLSPTEDAIDIEQVDPKKPVQLIVSDGNWRQASKIHRRQSELSHLPRLKISQKNLGQHKLRQEHFSEGFSTLEAIALALGHFEGPQVQEQLLGLYAAKLKATLIGRGIILFDRTATTK